MLLQYFQQAWRSTGKTHLISHVTWQVSPDFCLFRNFWKEKRSLVSPPTQPNFLVFGKFHLFWLYEYLCLKIIIHLGPTHFACISKITTRQTRNVCKNNHCRAFWTLYTQISIVNILSSDYSSVLKLYRKFEESCKMLWYKFHNDWCIVS